MDGQVVGLSWWRLMFHSAGVGRLGNKPCQVAAEPCPALLRLVGAMGGETKSPSRPAQVSGGSGSET